MVILSIYAEVIVAGFLTLEETQSIYIIVKKKKKSSHRGSVVNESH